MTVDAFGWILLVAVLCSMSCALAFGSCDFILLLAVMSFVDFNKKEWDEVDDDDGDGSNEPFRERE